MKIIFAKYRSRFALRTHFVRMSNLRKALVFIYTWKDPLLYIPFRFSDTILGEFNRYLWKNLWTEVSDSDIEVVVESANKQLDASLYSSKRDWLREYVHSGSKSLRNLPEFMHFVYGFVGPTSPLSLQLRWGRKSPLSLIPPEIRPTIIALTKSFYLNYLLERLDDSEFMMTLFETFCDGNFHSVKHLVDFQRVMNSPMDFICETILLEGVKILAVKSDTWFTVYACQALRCDSPILESLFWTKPRECNWYLISEYNRYHNSRMEEVD